MKDAVPRAPRKADDVQGLTLGIPRSLFFHTEGPLLCAYLDALGIRPVISPPTDRRIFNRGVTLAVDETCLPMKIHLGHVDALKGKVDAVLLPRYGVLPASQGDMCVKFWGVPDVTRNVFPGLPTLTYDVDRVYGGTSETRALTRLGRDLGASPIAARFALAKARRAASSKRAALAARQTAELAADPGSPVVLVAGHTYILDDELMGAPVIRLLRQQDVRVMRSDRLPDVEHLRAKALEFSPGLKWKYNREQLGAIAEMRGRVDGILVLLSFPCGPDSLVAELVQRKVHDTPVCVIVLDELTATGGLQTRVESFCDIVKMRGARAAGVTV
jgi:predicted nucleotide-binding protein (sugar kinase/HSP70/actin superfamily)